MLLPTPIVTHFVAILEKHNQIIPRIASRSARATVLCRSALTLSPPAGRRGYPEPLGRNRRGRRWPRWRGHVASLAQGARSSARFRRVWPNFGKEFVSVAKRPPRACRVRGIPTHLSLPSPPAPAYHPFLPYPLLSPVSSTHSFPFLLYLSFSPYPASFSLLPLFLSFLPI